MADSYVAHLRGAKVAPRKARLVVDSIRNKTVQDALEALKFLHKKSAPMVYKMIESAIANATHKATVDPDNLIVKDAFVNEGPTMKRFLPRAQGRATPIRKRTSHITIKIAEV